MYKAIVNAWVPLGSDIIATACIPVSVSTKASFARRKPGVRPLCYGLTTESIEVVDLSYPLLAVEFPFFFRNRSFS